MNINKIYKFKKPIDSFRYFKLNNNNYNDYNKPLKLNNDYNKPLKLNNDYYKPLKLNNDCYHKLINIKSYNMYNTNIYDYKRFNLIYDWLKKYL